jgi:hypothetical protein
MLIQEKRNTPDTVLKLYVAMDDDLMAPTPAPVRFLCPCPLLLSSGFPRTAPAMPRC